MGRAGSRSAARWTSGTRSSFAFTGLNLNGSDSNDGKDSTTR